MMKKLLTVVLALAMVFCMSATAFASQTLPVEVIVPAQSSGSSAPAEATPATPAEKTLPGTGNNGAAVKVTETASSVALTEVEAAATIAEVTGASAENLTVAYLKDLKADDLPVTITFNVAGVSANDTLYVLHYNGTNWEIVATGRGSSVTATFTSLSPVAVVVASGVTAPAVSGGSPRTGEQNLVLFAGAVALMASAVALMASKKKA